MPDFIKKVASGMDQDSGFRSSVLEYKKGFYTEYLTLPKSRRTKMKESYCGQLRDSNESIKAGMTYLYILDSFTKVGKAPTLDDIERDLFIKRDDKKLLLCCAG